MAPKRCGSPEAQLNRRRVGGGQRGQGVKPGIVQHPGSRGVDKRNPHKVAQLSLHAKGEPVLELREEELHVLPAESVAEDGRHPCERPRRTLQRLEQAFGCPVLGGHFENGHLVDQVMEGKGCVEALVDPQQGSLSVRVGQDFPLDGPPQEGLQDPHGVCHVPHVCRESLENAEVAVPVNMGPLVLYVHRCDLRGMETKGWC